MAADTAIHAVSATLLGLLRDYCRPALNAEFFDFFHPQDYRAKPEKQGFSLMLYRVGVNATLRNLPPRRDAQGRRTRPSLPLDLFYMLTPWARSADTQQLMLGWAMRFLEDHTVIPGSVVNVYAASECMRGDEAIELVCDPLPMADYLSLWDRLEPAMQTSATYVARMVLLDSDAQLEEGPAVQTRELRALPQPKPGVVA